MKFLIVVFVLFSLNSYAKDSCVYEGKMYYNKCNKIKNILKRAECEDKSDWIFDENCSINYSHSKLIESTK